MKSIYLIIPLIILISCRNNQNTTSPIISIDTTPKILLTGLRDIGYLSLVNRIAKPFGFRYFYVGSCVNSKQFSDSIRNNNLVAWNKLECKFGVGFRRNIQEKIQRSEINEFR